MDEWLKPYSGKEDYVFVSYAHKDSEEVLKVIAYLVKQGIRIWYDEGIDPGTEWDENIASHIDGCSGMIAFISENYLSSDNCKDELNYARDLDKKRQLIYLENVKLPSGMAMRLNRLQSIHKYAYHDEAKFYQKLLQSNIFISNSYQQIVSREEISQSRAAFLGYCILLSQLSDRFILGTTINSLCDILNIDYRFIPAQFDFKEISSIIDKLHHEIYSYYILGCIIGNMCLESLGCFRAEVFSEIIKSYIEMLDLAKFFPVPTKQIIAYLKEHDFGIRADSEEMRIYLQEFKNHFGLE